MLSCSSSHSVNTPLISASHGECRTGRANPARQVRVSDSNFVFFAPCRRPSGEVNSENVSNVSHLEGKRLEISGDRGAPGTARSSERDRV